jgi:D-alanyl-D-alanine carboxypeptidase
MFPFRSSKKRQLGLKHPPPYGSIGWVLPNCKGCGRSGRRRGLLDRILSFGGGFEPRFVRGSTTTLSNHSFGSAFDINVAWNERGHRPALVGEKGSVRELVPITHKWGFWWGGHFISR